MERILHSVGKFGANLKPDVLIVQTLLNRHRLPSAKLLRVDAICGPRTVNAILSFQFRLGTVACDGRVYPADQTFQALLKHPKSVPLFPSVPFNDSPNAWYKWGQNDPTGLRFDNYWRTSNDPYTRTRGNIRRIPFNSSESRRIHTVSRTPDILPPGKGKAIAWGAKVTPEFKERVIKICAELEISPDFLMACMAFETGETFRADIPNKAGSGAVGLIQFMPKTAEYYNTSTEALAKMTPVEQLEYVRKYFYDYKGKLHTLEDVYMAILYPKAIGKDPDTPIFKAPAKIYKQNMGFDANKDGLITPKECSAKLHAAYEKGLRRGYFG
jgi:hypothetical protein